MSKVLLKSLTYILAVVMVVGMLAGCGAAGKEPQETQETTQQADTQAQSAAVSDKSWETDKSPVDLSIFVDLPGTTFDKSWGKDDVSKKWIEETGVNLQWNSAADAEHSKLNILLASGDMPDLIYASPSLVQVKDLAKNDKIWALNKLAETAAPKFMQNFDKHMVVNVRLIFDSMDFYMVPFNYIKTKYMSNPYVTKNMEGILVIDKIYEEIGKPQIKTADDYISMLKQVKAKYPDMIGCQSNRNPGPDSDGNPNIVAKSLAIAGLSQRYFKQGDTYVKYWEHPDFIKLLTFVNTLYNEGLMDKTELTDKLEQLRGKLWGGKVFSDLNQDADNLDWFTSEMKKVKPDWGWKAIEPFTIDPATMKYTADSINGGAGLTGEARGLAVSKNSKNAERAIRFIDFLMQDQTQKEIIFGVEGKGHIMKGEVPEYTPEEQAAEKESIENERSTFGATAYWLFRDDYWGRVRNMATASEQSLEAFKIADASYADLSFYQGADSFAQDSEEQKIAITIKDYYQTEIVKIIMAKPDQVERMYNSMIERMKQLGLDKLNAFWTKYFNEKDSRIKKFSEGLE